MLTTRDGVEILSYTPGATCSRSGCVHLANGQFVNRHHVKALPAPVAALTAARIRSYARF